MKPNDINVITITTASDGTVYGLGDDGAVYSWNSVDGGWKLHVQE